MRPVGLHFKNPEQNLYTGRFTGELMIVHLCLNCRRISCNRIAGDDNPYQVATLLEEPNKLNGEIINLLTNQGVKLLGQEDKQEALTVLFGYDYHKYIK